MLVVTIKPFADPNAKKKYTETAYGAHVLSQARSLLGSTLFGIALTAGLHFYRGMVIGLFMQAVMGPLNMVDNALVKAVLVGKGIRPEDKIFQEKAADELTADDEVVDESGNPVVRSITNNRSAGASAGTTDKTKSLEDIMLDTWDDAAKADIGPLMNALNKKNCNHRTKESGWTPLMILSGLSVKGSGSAIRQVKELGGNPAIVDADGWNAMHWAGFHGSLEAAKALRDEGKLYLVKDKEGKTAIEHARAEGNDDVAKVLEELEAANSTKKDDGLRKRK